MRQLHPLIACTVLVSLIGCDADDKSPELQASAEKPGIATTVTELDVRDLPSDLVSMVTNAVPGMQIDGAERKEREGRVYFDVEGKRPDGSEVELDVLQEGSSYQIVEIQRDIDWSEAPEVARSAAATSGKAFEPVRVIESKQTDDSVIYELFAEGSPEKPSLEVRVVDGTAEVLKEEWKH